MVWYTHEIWQHGSVSNQNGGLVDMIEKYVCVSVGGGGGGGGKKYITHYDTICAEKKQLRK